MAFYFDVFFICHELLFRLFDSVVIECPFYAVKIASFQIQVL